MKKLLPTLALLLLANCTAFNPPQATYPSKSSIVPGETITVTSDQNVYAVARQHNVPMRDLIVLNDLQPPFKLKLGQKLTLPAGYSGDGTASTGAVMPSPSNVSVGTVESSELPPIQAAPLPPVSKGSSETKFANTPKSGMSRSAVESEALTTPSPQHSTVTTATPAPNQSPPPQQQVAAAVAPSPPLASPPADAPTVSFVWPIQGPVLSAYGPKGQGLNNDGVNIGAPKGAPVIAAGSGIVVYAGSEMKGFGNLVLIRHQNGWVTAYAHLDRVLVNKDAVVAQGDMIGTVGKTGGVSAPQLHFETRYQGKPVDPNSVMKGS
jgi:murein DD-endopeptidase MepM/ murein hydrolase activator NlpD